MNRKIKTIRGSGRIEGRLPEIARFYLTPAVSKEPLLPLSGTMMPQFSMGAGQTKRGTNRQKPKMRRKV